MITKKTVLSSAIHALCLGLTVGGLPSVALGQSSDDADEGVQVEEIVVTGSRIKRDSFSYSAPIAIIDSGTMDAVGVTNVGDVLQTLPQAISQNNNANSAFTTTSAGVNLTDLRFLGPSRTLVLVNGRRFVSGVNPGVGYGVDLNAIPTAVIDRIEVLTGGASAVYGSDAVAGVVNIITKNDFEGVDVTAQVGASSEGDKEREDITLTVGGEFAKGGNGWLSFGWSNDDALFARDRDFSNTDLAPQDTDGDGIEDSFGWLGSSFPPAGRFGSTGSGFLGDGTPFRSGIFDQANSDRFNRAQFRTIFVPVERRFAAGQANYQLTDNFNVFSEINFSLVEVRSELEPFALDINDDVFIQSRGGTGGHDVASSLLINEPLRASLLGAGVTDISQLGLGNAVRRLVEFGPRTTDAARTTIRGLAGFDYVLPNGWDVQGYYTYGKTDQDQETLGQINTERAAFALDVELAPDGMTVQCVDATARLQGCVPFNPFGEGTITPAAVAYLRSPANFQAQVEQRVFGLGLSGETEWTLPGGAFGFAVGAEYREERGQTVPGGLLQQGISGGNASLPTDGKFDVEELYAEVSAPVHDRLTLDAAVRAGDYSSVGSTTTWKFGADATLHDTVRVRATVGESVRAPNVSDLFRGAGETFRNVVDPCDGITNASTGVVADNCRSIQPIQDRIDATGAFTLTQVESQSAGGFLLGNPNVGEETADSFTLGVVWQPNFIEGLSASFDYYDIELKDAIAITLRTTVVERCYNVEQSMFDPTCGGALLRDLQPSKGAIVSVDSASSNENDFNTSGVDVEVAYARPIGPGDLSFGLLWNYLIEWDEIGIIDGDLDANAGEVVTPRNRGTGHVAYNWGDWQAFWRVRYWHSSTDSNSPRQGNENGFFAVSGPGGVNDIPSVTYSDVSLSYNPGRYRVTVGLNNAFDKQPPMLAQFSQWGNTGTNTATEAYDTIGRAWFLQFNYAY